MFFRIRIKNDDTADDGRPVSEHWQEHISWCIETFRKNPPDSLEVMKHMNETCVSWISRDEKSKKFFAGDATYNAFTEIVGRNKELWDKYATPDQRFWLRSFDAKFR